MPVFVIPEYLSRRGAAGVSGILTFRVLALMLYGQR